MHKQSLFFSDASNSFRHRLFRNVIRALTGFTATAMPHMSTKLAKKLLANAYGKRRVDFSRISPTAEFSANTKLGEVQLYHFSGGPTTTLVSHGWADSTQSMETIIETLLSKGQSVWAFDHIGHGKSEGKTSHLFGYIDGLKATLDFLTAREVQLDGIVAHSMGAAAVLNLDANNLADKKLVLMGLPVRFFESMRDKMSEFGISHRVLSLMLRQLSTEYFKDWNELSPEKHRIKLKENVLVVHGKQDRQCPIDELEDFVRGTSVRKVISPELGHRRILTDKAVMDEMSAFLHG